MEEKPGTSNKRMFKLTFANRIENLAHNLHYRHSTIKVNSILLAQLMYRVLA